MSPARPPNGAPHVRALPGSPAPLSFSTPGDLAEAENKVRPRPEFSVFDDLPDPQVGTLLAAFAHPEGMAGIDTAHVSVERLKELAEGVAAKVGGYIDDFATAERSGGVAYLDLATLLAVQPVSTGRFSRNGVKNAAALEGGTVTQAFEDVERNRPIFRDLHGNLFVRTEDECAHSYHIGERLYPLQPARAFITLLQIRGPTADELMRLVAEHNKATRKRA